MKTRLPFAWVTLAASSTSALALAQLPEYGPLVSVTEGTSGADHLTALDIDADGDIDLVATNSNDNDVLWFEALSPGQFSAPQVLVRLAGGPMFAASTLDVALLDLTGAGSGGDLIVTQRLQRRILRLPRTGPRTFGSPVTIAQPSGAATSLATFDFDGDGDTDLMTSGAFGTPGTWILENAGGTLAAPVRLGDGGRRIEPTDFDLDGDLDLVVTSPGGAAFSLRNDGVIGPLVSSQFAQSTIDFDLSVADLNGDGFDDVAVSGYPPRSVEIFLGDGAGAFTSGASFSYSLFHGADPFIAALDLDGDLDIDVAVAPLNRSQVDWIENLGGGTFAPIAQERFIASDVTVSFSVAEVDGDGHDDLLVVGGASSAQIALSTGIASLDTLTELTRSLDRIEHTFPIDADADGDLDVAVMSRDQGVGIAFNDGTGGLEFPTPLPGFATQGARRLNAAHADDLDGDGRTDIVFATYQGPVRWSRQTPAGFASPVSVGGSDARVVRTADVDADGRIDIVVPASGPDRLVAFRQLANGTFGSPITVATLLGRPIDFVFRDMDADGLLDIVSFEDAPMGTGSDRYFVYYGVPGGGYDVGTVMPLPQFPSILGTTLFEDLDGDARPDVVFRSGAGQDAAVWWIRNLGGRQYAPAAIVGVLGDFILGLALRPPSAGAPTSLAVVTSVTSARDRFRIFGLTGSTTLGASVEVPGIGRETSALFFADLGTGGQDLVIADSVLDRLSVSRDLDWRDLGTNYCGPAPMNTFGRSGRISAFGSADSTLNRLDLVATQLPPGVLTLFLASFTPGFAANPNGSQGNLCLGGAIGRLNQPGVFGSSNAAGAFRASLDLGAIPQPTGAITILPQSLWHFQAWHRDFLPGLGITSNFTDAVEIRFDG